MNVLDSLRQTVCHTHQRPKLPPASLAFLFRLHGDIPAPLGSILAQSAILHRQRLLIVA